MFESKTNPGWYKNPIVWMVIFFPSVAIVAGFITLFIAIDSDDGLVDSNYYKQGLGINKVIKNDANAIALNISGLISINATTGDIQVKFSNQTQASLGSTINFKLAHRTSPGFDQETKLTQVDDTLLYTGKINALPNSGGRWRWEIKHDDWRISERFLSNNDEVILHSFPKKTS